MRNAVGRGLDDKRRGYFGSSGIIGSVMESGHTSMSTVTSYIDVDSHGVVICGSGSADVVGLGPEGCTGFV